MQHCEEYSTIACKKFCYLNISFDHSQVLVSKYIHITFYHLPLDFHFL